MTTSAPPPRSVPAHRPDPGDLATFWELALDVLVQVAPDGTFLHVNPAFTRLLGWPRDQVVGKQAFDFLHPDDVGTTVAGFEAIGRPGTTISDFENRYRTADGGYRALRWNARMSMDSQVIHAVAHDVTEEHDRLEALRLSEERFRTSMQSAAIGMAIVALDGRFVEVNDALCRIVGRPRDVLTTHTFPEITHPDDVDADIELVRQLADGTIDSYDLEKRYLRPDETAVCVLLTASVVRHSDGTPRYYIAQVQDVSARKAAEAELARTLEELRQSNGALAEFAAIVAHDLKTPLAVATGMVDTLRLRYPDDLSDGARDLVARTAARLRGMAHQVDGLLRLASLGSRTMEVEDVVLDDAIAATRSLLGDSLDGVGIEVDAPDVVQVDAAALAVLLQNVLANAATHGGVRVEVRSRVTDGWVVVEVDDDGGGVPPEDRDLVFDPFARSTTEASGTGLGLALCRRVVERHGGEIGITDAPLGGARLWFTLPTPSARALDDLGVDAKA